MSLLSLFALGLLASQAVAVPAASSSLPSNTKPTTTILATATAKNTGLNEAAKNIGKLWFGTAADIPGTAELSDRYYMKEFNNTLDFGEATPANVMKVSESFGDIEISNADLLIPNSSCSPNPRRASSTSPAETTSSTSPKQRAKRSAATTSSGLRSFRTGSQARQRTGQTPPSRTSSATTSRP